MAGWHIPFVPKNGAPGAGLPVCPVLGPTQGFIWSLAEAFSSHQQSKFLPVWPVMKHIGQQQGSKGRCSFFLLEGQSACSTAISSQPPSLNWDALQQCWSSCWLVTRSLSLLHVPGSSLAKVRRHFLSGITGWPHNWVYGFDLVLFAWFKHLC